MKVSIITPTYNRPHLLLEAIKSVLIQDYNNFELIIINDSPDMDYTTFEKYVYQIKDPRIKYFKNSKREGVNYSRNIGLDKIAIDSELVLFLDDDETLLENSLRIQVNLIKNNNCNWLYTLHNQNPYIKSYIKKQEDGYYSFMEDFSIKRKFIGDYTSMLKSCIIKSYNIRFSKKVMNAEEWIFFTRYSRYSSFYFCNIFTKGGEYLDDGLTKQEVSNWKTLKRNTLACYEIFFEGIYIKEKFYMLIKLVNSIRKIIF